MLRSERGSAKKTNSVYAGEIGEFLQEGKGIYSKRHVTVLKGEVSVSWEAKNPLRAVLRHQG